MIHWKVTAAVLLLAASPAFAGSYRIELDRPAVGKMLVGHAGVVAVDDETDTAKVRVIAPGNEVRQRGTVRVLVMNRSSRPFEFGPDQVSLILGDGTRLRPVSVEAMEKGRILVERESHYAGIADRQNRNNLEGLASQSGGGPSVQTIAPPSGGTTPGGARAATLGQDRTTDEELTPGFETLNGIYQILIPLTVEPQKAWGGYYVFDVPKPVLARRTDQPLTILVRTGAEEHRFAAALKWR